MKSNYKKLGQYIKQVSRRNSDLSVTDLKGISIDKEFMPSVANVNGTDLSKYRVVSKEQFAYNPMHVGRDEILPISMLTSDDDVIVSPAYVVFEIIDKNELNPEYLMMWFRRPEFDRNAWFTTDSSVRGGYNWEDFCNMELPVTDIEVQREIVKEYNSVVNRIKLNEDLNKKLEDTAQTIYKQWFVDFEFPIDEEYANSINRPDLIGKPYKSNGGEMVFNEALQQEIPKGWEVAKMEAFYEFQYGKGNNNPDNKGKYPIYGSNGIIGGFDKYNNEDAPVIGHIGVNCGSLKFAFGKHFVTYNGIMCNIKDGLGKYFGYCTLLNQNLTSQNRGSSQPFISYDMLYDISIVISKRNLIDDFENKINTIFSKINLNNKQLKSFINLSSLLLSRMASQTLSIENE